jgi:membrane fusion protein (multidrug efflux system)
MKMKQVKSVALGLTVLLAAATVSCDKPARQMPSKSYKTLTAARSNSAVSNYYTASIRGEQFVELRPQVSGMITAIRLNEGAPVKKGQTLFVIDQVPYKAALATAVANVKSAKASLATAELNAKSRQALFNEKVISDTELQAAQNNLLASSANLAQAEAQALNARNNLSYTEVKSPVDGVAGMIPYRVGALVSPSIAQPLVSVSNDASMHIYFSMSEAQILAQTRLNGSVEQLLEKMPAVELILSDGSPYQHKGKVDAISGIVDPSTGSVALRAVFDNPEKMLRNGGSGRVVIETELKDVIVIPKEATFEIQNKVFVYKAVDGKASASQVEVYPVNNGTSYIVQRGLESGEEIIAAGAGLVREGAPIKGNQAAAQPKGNEKK